MPDPKPATTTAVFTVMSADGTPVSDPIPLTLVRVGDEWLFPDPPQAEIRLKGTANHAQVLLTGEAAPRVITFDYAIRVRPDQTLTLRPENGLALDWRPGFDVTRPETWTAEEHAIAVYVRQEDARG